MRNVVAVIIVVALLGTFAPIAGAEPPTTVTFAGTLSRWGVPVDGPVDLRVRLYASESSLEEISAETSYDGILVERGAFSITIPVPNELEETSAWAEVDVRTEAWPAFSTLQPRQKIELEQSATSDGVPSGSVVFFDRATCPAGWIEYALLRGRTAVGVPSFGTLAAEVGVPLSDREYPSHRHYFPSATYSGSVPDHQHVWARTDGIGGQRWLSYDASGQEIVVTTWSNGIGNEGSGYFPLAKSSTGTQTLYTQLDGGHRHSLASGYTDSKVAVLPYVQLLACVKE